jgi:hypothetical protein
MNTEYYKKKYDNGKDKSLMHERMLRAVVKAMVTPDSEYGACINEILDYVGIPKAERIATVFSSVSRVMDFGTKKYQPDSWQTLQDGIERYKDALKRHWVNKYGVIILNDNDRESDLFHYQHALCNCMFLIWLTEVKRD